MKKLAFLFLCAALCIALLSPAMAETFDPCAHPWFVARSESITTYHDGTVETSFADYSKPAVSWNIYTFRENGTLIQDTIPAIGEAFTENHNWERISDTKIQYTTTVGENEVTYELEYVNGELVMEGETVFEDCTTVSKTYLTADEEHAVGQASWEYRFVDERDPNVEETCFTQDYEFTAFLDYTFVMYFGSENPFPRMMGESYNGWIGSIKWHADNNVSLVLDCKGELLQIDAEGTAVFGEVSGTPGMILELTDEAAGKYYTASITKMADRQNYYLEFHNDSGIPVVFQVIPSWAFE